MFIIVLKMSGISRGLIIITLLISLFVFCGAETRMRTWLDGKPCEWEGVRGTCVNFWTCDTNALDAAVGNHPPVCSFKNGEVFSCCTGCQLVANISKSIVLVDYGRMEVRTGKKSIDKCYEHMLRYRYPCNKRDRKLDKQLSGDCFYYTIRRYGAASNGRDAERNEYPHMALLGYGEDVNSAEWLCGGTIISDRYILTAAHCRQSDRLGAVKYAGVGILKRSDPRDLWQVYRVDRFTPHDDHTPRSNYHDIALIRTDRRIVMGRSVVPACLPRGDEDMETAHVTGWGALGHRAKQADTLQTVQVSRYSSDKCSEHYTPHSRLAAGYNHTTQMCYGDTDVGRDACEGDSGGPLQLERCPHVVVGVTSSGHPCGFPDSPGLYTRVLYYVPWIESIVWP